MLVTDGPDVVGKAALYGGTTTLSISRYGARTAPIADHRGRDKQFAGDCPSISLSHMMLREHPDTIPARRVPEAVQAGHPTVKIFTTDIPRRARAAWSSSATSGKSSRSCAKAGGLATIHAEDNDIVMHMYEKLIREKRTGFENMAEVHNTLSEDLSFNRVIRLAENVEGAALYMMQSVGGDRRSGDRRRARQRLADLRRNLAPVHDVQRPRTIKGRTGRSTTPTRP